MGRDVALRQRGADTKGKSNSLSNSSLSNNPLSPLGGSLSNSSLSRSDISPQRGENKDIKGIVLKPNQQAILSPSGRDGKAREGRILVKEIDPGSVVDWKNGEFQFNDEPLGSIMRKIARWYNVEIIYKDINPDKPFWGAISRFENISKVLEKLELTGTIHFKVEGRKVYVSQ
ncbi:MAG: DUF4974 domain-containing protein [Pedobacter sp.]|nr:MAG: DUF4974 domain-containing protein [Pedobacter sp.]